VTASIELNPDAQHNGLACMLAELIRANVAQHPQKQELLNTTRGSVAIVAEDAQVALTLLFDTHGLTIHDGIHGIPNVTIRAQSGDISKLSLMQFVSPFGMPKLSDATTRELVTAILKRRIRVYAEPQELPILGPVSQLMSVD
jgi:hypothetical protein